MVPWASRTSVLKRLRAALDGQSLTLRSTHSSDGTAKVAYQHNPMTPPEKRDRIVALYRRGERVKDISSEVGLHRSTVASVLRKAGFEKQAPLMSPAMVDQAVRLSAQGLSYITIGLRLGVSRSTIGRTLLTAKRV